VTLNSFGVLRFLGAGAFGKVYLVRRRETGDLYALKAVALAAAETVRREHEIFRKIAGEHLVTAPFSFNEQDSHIFIL
jgi:serine/threonine protein kinase